MTDAATYARKIAGELKPAMKRADEVKAQKDHFGTIYLGADDAVNVLLDGASEPTPCTAMVGVHQGDRVVAHKVGHRVFVFANITAPTTDDAQALVAVNRADAATEAADRAGQAAAKAVEDAADAKAAAEAAKESAGQAATAAQNAESDAGRAATAAENAEGYASDAAGSAEDAAASAQDAADSATAAQRSADDADLAARQAQQSSHESSVYANAALGQLGAVQDVLGVLEWAYEHGRFTPTDDYEVDPSKAYFTYDAFNGYMPVTQPKADELDGYYELSVDEAMQGFIMDHLAVTDRGLWVVPHGVEASVTRAIVDDDGNPVVDEDGNPVVAAVKEVQHSAGYKVLLSNDGVYVYDDDGVLVTTFGESITYSSLRPQYIGSEDAYIMFTPATESDGAQIVIGGDNVSFVDTPLSEMLASVEQASSDASDALETALDGAFLAITSTNGQLFKNGQESTILQVVVFPNGGDRLDTISAVRERFGNSAYIEWKCKNEGGSWTTLANNDSHISQGGMWLTVTPTDVDVKTTFAASLVTT